jgi:hypothetical protein
VIWCDDLRYEFILDYGFGFECGIMNMLWTSISLWLSMG